jgi:DNA-binding transcriptional LysR family regulator
MDLRQLEILRAIAESGSFTAAGARLNVSQSAISRQILLLEEEFKEPLFIRFGRRIQITPTGETLLQLSHRVFADIKDTSESILDTKKKLSGTLRLVGGMTVCLYVFPTLLKEFRRHHPDVDIKVITGGTPRLVRKLRAGAADLGLLTLPIDDQSLATGIGSRPQAFKRPGRRAKRPRTPAVHPVRGRLQYAAGHRRVLRASRHQAASRGRNGKRRNHQVDGGFGSRHQHRSVSISRTRNSWWQPVGRADRGTDARARDRLGPPARRSRAPDGP